MIHPWVRILSIYCFRLVLCTVYSVCNFPLRMFGIVCWQLYVPNFLLYIFSPVYNYSLEWADGSLTFTLGCVLYVCYTYTIECYSFSITFVCHCILCMFQFGMGGWFTNYTFGCVLYVCYTYTIVCYSFGITYVLHLYPMYVAVWNGRLVH